MVLPDLIKRMNSRRAQTREQAIVEALKLPPEQMVALIAAESRHYAHSSRRARNLTTLLLLGVLGGLFLLCMATGEWAFLVLLMYYPYLAVGYAFGFMPTRARRSMLQVLVRADDPNFVGPALVMLSDHGSNGDVRKHVTTALQRLLPSFRADQSALLTPAQMKALLVCLTMPYRHPDLTISLLKALEQIGDETALPFVRKIAQTQRPNAKKRPVVEAAQQCLPFLTQKLERKQQAQTLLRPVSGKSSEQHDALLRPATSSSLVEPELLLRVSQESEAQDTILHDETTPAELERQTQIVQG